MPLPGWPTFPLSRRGVLGGMAVAMCPRRVRAAAAEWRLVTEYPADTMPGEGVATFAALAGQRAEGTVAVIPGYDAPDGIRSARMLDAVAAGMVAAADAFTGALSGAHPVFQLSSLPFLTASIADAGRLWRIAEPDYRDVLASRGLVLLYATPWPPTGLWTRWPLAGAASLTGLRVRTYDAASTAVLAAAGAAPVALSFADAVPRLRSGDLDAVLSSGDGGAGARLWEVLPWFTVLDYAFPLSLAFCGAKALEQLPGAARNALAGAGPLTTARQFEAVAGRIERNEARITAQGVTITRDPDVRAALINAAAPAVADCQARSGEAGRRILAAYRGG